MNAEVLIIVDNKVITCTKKQMNFLMDMAGQMNDEALGYYSFRNVKEDFIDRVVVLESKIASATRQ